MKTLFLCIALLYAATSFSQPAKVLAVFGKPYRASGEVLKVGDKLKEGEAVFFNKNTDTVMLLVLEKGIGYYTRGRDPRTAKAKAAEWRYAFRDIFWVKDEKGILVGRGPIINSLDDLRQFFSLYRQPASSLLVIDSLALHVGPGLKENFSKGYFFLQYIRNGDTINKKLVHNLRSGVKKTELIIDTSVLRVDHIRHDALVREKCTLNLYDRITDSSYQIVSFYTSIISSNSITPSLCLLKTEAENWESLASDFVTWLYGVPDNNAFKQFLADISCR